MKYEITYKEAAEILAKVAKAEEKVNAFFEADAEYDRISGIADDYFAEHGTYSMPAIDARCAARDRRERACKNAFNAIVEAAALTDPSPADYRWEVIENNAKKRYTCNLRETFGMLKGIVKEQMKYIQF